MIDEAYLVLPDIHGDCGQDERALSIVFAAMRRLNEIYPITRVIQLGDLLEGAEFSSHDPSSVYEEKSYWVDELAWGARFWEDVAEVLPNAQRHFIEGNHENRIHKHFGKSLKGGKTTLEMYEAMNAGNRFKKQGVDVSFYGQGTVKGSVLMLRDNIFCHGWSHAIHAAKNHLDKTLAGRDIFFGHVHRAASYIRKDPITNRMVGSWSFGTLCRVSQYFHRGTPNDHSLGFGVIMYDNRGNKSVIHIPIHNENDNYGCILPSGDTIYVK